MIRFSLFLALLMAFFALPAQSLQGTVTSTEGDTLPGVNITLVNRYTAGTTTDASGFYMLKPGEGTCQLRFSAVGYEAQTVVLSLQGII